MRQACMPGQLVGCGSRLALTAQTDLACGKKMVVKWEVARVWLSFLLGCHTGRQGYHREEGGISRIGPLPQANILLLVELSISSCSF